MGIIGERPESGVRLDLERPRAGGPPWEYSGHVVTPAARFAARATVLGDGAVSVAIDGDAPLDIADQVKLIVRAAYKHAQADLGGVSGVSGAADASDDVSRASPPPRRIQRWRADK
jgi:hypothetical protein